MPLYLVRHAKAGNRSKWVGPDELRPLTKSGREQADRLAGELADEPITRILSSPYVRCMQTVEPLGRKRGVEVMVSEANPRVSAKLQHAGISELLGPGRVHATLSSALSRAAAGEI